MGIWFDPPIKAKDVEDLVKYPELWEGLVMICLPYCGIVSAQQINDKLEQGQ